MRYFLDTEFSERPCTIDLISLAIVAEDTRELYVVSSQFDADACNPWVKANVLPNLQVANREGRIISRPAIKFEVIAFIGDDPKPEFWGYYADYDWVAFCWLFGAMIDLPKGWPMYCRDLKQEDGGLRFPYRSESHNALEDARCIAANYKWLSERTKESFL